MRPNIWINEMSESQALRWLDILETGERRRSRLPENSLRKSLAKRLGWPAGTLENLKRGRLKRVPVALLECLGSAVAREIEAELPRLAHELEMARQVGVDPRSDAFCRAAAALEEARKAIAEVR